ncbi:MAG: hypothetical protein ABWX92_09240 [Mycetocola sp.]
MARHAVTFTPGDSTGAQKRAQRREAARTVAEERPARSTRKDRALPEPAVPGPFGPGLVQGGYWNLATANIAAHQATSQHIAGIYPFVADSGLGHRGPVIGVDLNADALWHFSPWESYIDASERGTFSTNILVLGAYRSGKSATIKTLTTRSIAFGHQVVVPSDPKGEWVTVAEAIPGGRVIRLGGGTGARLNPLDRGPRRSDASDEQHEQMVKQRRIRFAGQPSELLIDAAEGGVVAGAGDAPVERVHDRGVLDRGESPVQGHLDEGDQGADAALLDHLLVLFVGRVGATWAPVERVESSAGVSAEPNHSSARDRLGDGDPLAFRIGRDDDLVAERDRASDERLYRRGLAASVRTEHEDVRREGSAVGRVRV